MSHLDQFVADIAANHPTLSKSLAASIETGGVRLTALANDILEHYRRLADNDISVLARAFATMVLRCNKLQLKYELTGKYAAQSYDDARASVYDHQEDMRNYMLGLVCSQFAWANHFKLWCFFEDNFLNKLAAPEQVLEIAPGHGYFGLNLLRHFPGARLTGIDISATSLEISRAIAREFEQESTEYRHQDAMQLSDQYANNFSAVICGELLEHVPQPERILSNTHKALRPGGLAYVTAAITAAAPDHIYEFESPEQVIEMVESVGLTVIDRICEGTLPLTERAKGAPRVLSMTLTKA